MTYKLSGAVGLRDRVEPGSFLIPIFTTSASNRLFAQQLDENDKIVSFKIIEVSNFPFEYQTARALDVEIGDIGIVCFANENSTIIIQDARSARELLRSMPNWETISPFRQLDICYFTGDSAKLKRAISAAAGTIKNPAVSRTWKKVERTAAKRRRSSPELFVELASLRGSFDSIDGHDRWLSAWKSIGPTDWLIRDGVKLAFYSDKSIGARARIAVHVLEGARAKSVSAEVTAYVKAVVTNWLSSASVTEDTGVWSRVWLTINQQQTYPDRELYKWGTSFLLNPRSRSQSTSGRVKIWEALWDSVHRNTEELISILRADLSEHRTGSHARRLIGLLAELADEAPISDVLRDWLAVGDPGTSQWSTAYLALLRSGQNNDQKFVEIGKNWLKNDEGKLKKWAEIYEEISYIRGKDELIPIAAEWLLRANKEMKVWPKIASLVYNELDDAELRRAIENWIDTHPGTDESWELQLLVNQSGPDEDVADL